VRYDRELVQTTIKAMKRVGEIKQRREHAFWKNRYLVFKPAARAQTANRFLPRMAVSREKRRVHRRKVLENLKSSSTQLLQPDQPTQVREKIKVPATHTALIKGEGRSMTMDID
jgi:large subunit ribosomal protein L24e